MVLQGLRHAISLQELALAPVTPGAVQAQNKQRSQMPSATVAGPPVQRRSPLQDALADAAEEGLQQMQEPCAEAAASAQPARMPMPIQAAQAGSLQEPSLTIDADSAARAVPFTGAAAMPMEQENAASHRGQNPAALKAAEDAKHSSVRDTEMAEASIAQGEAAAGAGDEEMAVCKHKQAVQGADVHCYISIGQLPNTEAAAGTKPDQAPSLLDLPLTSLFGICEGGQKPGSGQVSSEPDVCPSAAPAASLPASNDSNQENQLPEEDEPMQRYIMLPMYTCLVCLQPVQQGIRTAGISQCGHAYFLPVRLAAVKDACNA